MNRSSPPRDQGLDAFGRHEVRLLEHDIRYLSGHGSNIENLDLAETCHVGDEPIEPGPDIDMHLRPGFVYPPGDHQVLPEILAFGDATFVVAIVKLWIERDYTLVDSTKAPVVTNESRNRPKSI